MGNDSQKDLSEQYVQIHTRLLAIAHPTATEVFIRLGRSKYVKLFNMGEVVTVEELKRRFEERGVDYLYIRKDAGIGLLAHLKAYFDKTTSEGEGKLEEVAYTAQEVIQSLGALLGFTPEVQEIAKQGIKATLAVVGTNPKLQDFLKRLGTDQTHYITSHSMALARVACSISASMDWPSGSTFLKLTFASFFHDITLTNQALCKIRTNEELLATGNQFTVEECDEFRNHPNAAADLIRSYPEVPADVDVIIRQHHELPDGSGFPRKIGGPALAPLSCVFIFSHGLVRAFYEPNPQESVTQFLNDFRERYNNSTFRKIYAALDKNREAFAAAGIPI